MKNKIIILVLLGFFAISANAKTQKVDDEIIKKLIQSFQDGYSSAFYQMEREFKTQGWKRKKIQFKKYMVVVNMDQLTQSEVFLYKHFATSIGRTAITITDDLLVMGSANRRVDANDLIQKLNKGYLSSFEYKSYLYTNIDNKEYIAAPIVYKAIFDRMRKEIQDDAKVKVLVIEKPVKIKVNVKEVSPVVISKPMHTNNYIENKKLTPKKKQEVKKAVINVIVPPTEKVIAKIKKIEKKYERYIFPLGEIQALGMKNEEKIQNGIKEDFIVSRGFIKGKSIRIEKIINSDDDVKYGKIVGKELFVDMESIRKEQ